MSLTEFVRAKRRADCRVCKLSDEVREQLVTASDRGIKQATVLEWLRDSVGVPITRDELSTHRNGRHDEAA